MKVYIWRITTSGGFTMDYWSFNTSVKLARDYLNEIYGKQNKDYFKGKPTKVISPPFVAAVDTATSRLYKTDRLSKLNQNDLKCPITQMIQPTLLDMGELKLMM